jgi:hypothetical protein
VRIGEVRRAGHEQVDGGEHPERPEHVARAASNQHGTGDDRDAAARERCEMQDAIED